MKKKIMIGAAVVLLGGGYVAKGMLMPKPVDKSKIKGAIYVLPKAFTLNMTDGRYATLTVALNLAPGQSDGAGAGGEGAPAPPEGFGTLPEEPAIRDIITNVVTDQKSSSLTTDAGRMRVKRTILQAIRTKTDVKVSAVLFTDVAVQ
jgi:flagellar basal body-associated protein FliL